MNSTTLLAVLVTAVLVGFLTWRLRKWADPLVEAWKQRRAAPEPEPEPELDPLIKSEVDRMLADLDETRRTWKDQP